MRNGSIRVVSSAFRRNILQVQPIWSLLGPLLRRRTVQIDIGGHFRQLLLGVQQATGCACVASD